MGKEVGKQCKGDWEKTAEKVRARRRPGEGAGRGGNPSVWKCRSPFHVEVRD